MDLCTARKSVRTSTIITANYCKGSLGIIDPSTDRFVMNVTVGSFPNGVTTSPDGKYIYVTVVGLTKNSQQSNQQVNGSGSPRALRIPGTLSCWTPLTTPWSARSRLEGCHSASQEGR